MAVADIVSLGILDTYWLVGSAMNSSKQCQRERRLKSQNIKLNKMRREGNIIQEIVEYNNIAAFHHVVRVKGGI